MSATHTGAVLLKCTGPLSAPEAWPQALKKVALDCVPMAESLAAYAALEGHEAYVYLFSRNFPSLDEKTLSRVAQSVHSLPDWKHLQVSLSRLGPWFDSSGAARGQAAPFHYVVETDVVPGHDADLNAWYDTEHMPGLAACAGSVRARRFLNPDGSPRYHSCYDLVSTETLGSEPWLAVRHTEWSSRVRPHFRNTRRTMFRRLFDIAL
jgi:hypothetical protein